MAENPANGVSWYLEVARAQADLLGLIRHWPQVKMATDEESVWLKDLTQEQASSAMVKSIPFVKVYYQQEHLLFPEGKLLPARKVPSLLWTPISRALPVTLPDENHYFFGIQEQISITLTPSAEERSPVALLTDIGTLKDYVRTAPAIRLKHLRWTVLQKQQALLFGQPMLPVPGETFWQLGCLLLPSGQELSLPWLAEAIQQQLQPEAGDHCLWLTGGARFMIRSRQLKPLSIGSFRQTYQLIHPALSDL